MAAPCDGTLSNCENCNSFQTCAGADDGDAIVDIVACFAPGTTSCDYRESAAGHASCLACTGVRGTLDATQGLADSCGGLGVSICTMAAGPSLPFSAARDVVHSCTSNNVFVNPNNGVHLNHQNLQTPLPTDEIGATAVGYCT
jgi:hypothetical protein